MVINAGRLTVSTPGRICLFGEHQDYLGLPVIPAAISLRMTIDGISRSDASVRIQLPDIDGEELFSLEGALPYTAERDYFRSGVNVMRRHGFTFTRGFDCVVRGNIPIQAGTSSSSALVVSWIHFLSKMAERPASLTPAECGAYAVEAEVLEFREPGGMMDQFSTAYGGLLFIDFHPETKVEQLPTKLGTFVLGDSGEAKDTREILARVKTRVIDIAKRLTAGFPEFALRSLLPEDTDRWKAHLDRGQFALLEGTARNHAMTREAKKLLMSATVDERRFGELLSAHHAVLRDVLRISTPKIDRMLDAAQYAGAYGGKINGSGGGGCMFAYAPEKPEGVADAIARVGGTPYIITVDEGTRVEKEKGS
jgi:galactokinase